MTIAACYVCSEGVVFGADSTATFLGEGSLETGYQTYDYTQKVFEIGESGSTLGFVSCGPQCIQNASFRTMLADLSDDLLQNPPSSVEDVVTRWRNKLWSMYCEAFTYEMLRCKEIHAKSNPTLEEENESIRIRQLLTGTCSIGGRVAASRTPCAYYFTYGPLLEEPPRCDQVPPGCPRFWGCPNLLERLQFGIEEQLIQAILASEHWAGTEEDFYGIVREKMLQVSRDLPIRDAIDWVYSSILITIKGMKFSRQPPVCGGPIDVAVITTDRPFRWVCHKSLVDAVIVPGSE